VSSLRENLAAMFFHCVLQYSTIVVQMISWCSQSVTSMTIGCDGDDAGVR